MKTLEYPMKVLQINAVYEQYSTGRSSKELHEAMVKMGIRSFVACRYIPSGSKGFFQIGWNFDWKLHALFSRLTGKQGYFSKIPTRKLIKYIEHIKPDVIHLRNLHSNYINFPILLEYIANMNIATVLTLHDCWFFTGKCNYYKEYDCSRWLEKCGKCPALKSSNKSWFFDYSKKMLSDKRKLFGAIDKLAVIGVSQWVTEDARKSILSNARLIRCIYNWIDLDQFRPQECSQLKNTMNLSGKFIILGIAAIWNKLKGIEVFNELARILSDEFMIILVGDYSQLKTRNTKIRFLGTLHEVTKLASLYSMADVFMNPTIQETFGKTTAEAMACGTPVVAYNGTATPELIGYDGKCGYLIDDNRAEIYKEKILCIKANGKNSYTQETRNRAKLLFSRSKNIQEYLDVYRELLHKQVPQGIC